MTTEESRGQGITVEVIHELPQPDGAYAWNRADFDWNASRYECDCGCGKSWEGDYALYDYLHHVCPHTFGTVDIGYFRYLMCAWCGEMIAPKEATDD